jgi:hypothetical protein
MMNNFFLERELTVIIKFHISKLGKNKLIIGR